MFSGMFGKTVDLLSRGMDVAVLRRNVISNNIANAETPNFKRTTVNFEASLRRALDSEKVVPPRQFATHPRHIPFHRTVDYRTVRPRLVLDYLTTAKNNGNNVDIEEEGMLALQNQLLYQTMATAVSGQYGLVNLVLR
ncbi:MAG: flagellar basal body rod protein FlgB [Spirochaetales bacterium]|nr:flagellar basal body rod protein FlgB [Spirochaetales bacterium]